MDVAYLVTEGGRAAPRSEPIDGVLIIGRGNDCDFVVDDAAASRQHVEIARRSNGFVWRDLESTNGTLLNGTRMLEGLLKKGDRLQIGETVLRLEVEESETEAPPIEDSSFFKQTVLESTGAMPARTRVAKADEVLGALYRVINEIASNYEPCSLVDRILEATTGAIHAQRAALFFATPDGELAPCPVCGRYHLIQDGRLQHVDRESARISTTVTRRVLSEGESVLYKDNASDREIEAAESVLALDLRSILCVPLRGKQRIFGLLYLDSNRPGQPYSHEDMLLTSAIGHSAGLALDNAHLHMDLLEKQRVDLDIQNAWSIQQGFLFKDWPENDPRFRVYGVTYPARVVGGDFYDFAHLPDDRVGILIGDVSGKGVPAALSMAQLLAEFRITVLQDWRPGFVMSVLNQQMYERSRHGVFCTICYGVVDLRTGKVEFCNAGHHAALVGGPSGVRELAPASGPPIGILPEVHWTAEEAQLAPGETILLYTDGIAEATPVLGEGSEYGEVKLEDKLASHVADSPREMVEAVYADACAYCIPADPHDDCTLIALRYEGGP